MADNCGLHARFYLPRSRNLKSTKSEYIHPQFRLVEQWRYRMVHCAKIWTHSFYFTSLISVHTPFMFPWKMRWWTWTHENACNRKFCVLLSPLIALYVVRCAPLYSAVCSVVLRYIYYNWQAYRFSKMTNKLNRNGKSPAAFKYI